MAKVQIKSEKLTLFEGFFSIMELFSLLLILQKNIIQKYIFAPKDLSFLYKTKMISLAQGN